MMCTGVSFEGWQTTVAISVAIAACTALPPWLSHLQSSHFRQWFLPAAMDRCNTRRHKTNQQAFATALGTLHLTRLPLPAALAAVQPGLRGVREHTECINVAACLLHILPPACSSHCGATRAARPLKLARWNTQSRQTAPARAAAGHQRWEPMQTWLRPLPFPFPMWTLGQCPA